MLTQTQTQRQTLKILPQQIQLLNLYFLNNLELEQRIRTELEENPFLDANEEETYDEADAKPTKDDVQDYQDWEERGYDDVPDYREEYQNYFTSEVAPNVAMAGAIHFKDDARQQLRMLTLEERQFDIADYLINALNHQGLMDKPLAEMADEISFSQGILVDEEEVLQVLRFIQTLDPIGLGSRSVQECLEIQLMQMDSRRPEIAMAQKLVQHHFNDLMHRQFEKIYHQLSINDEELRTVLGLIGGLKFHPVIEEVSHYEPKTTIIPDYIISRFGDTIQVNLYSSRSAAVFVNQGLYEQLAGQITNRDRGANQYIKSKLASAQWFVNAVKQREDTMMRIMTTIVEMQHEYFLEGDIRMLKPMVLRMVAEKAGLDISTVSRITSNKYAETHFGLVYLKDLFSEGIADKKGEVISNKVIQSVIEEAIAGEDKRKPYTDQQLVNILSAKGYNIARRTVAKYREQMRIPIAQIRAVWA